jgi:hypothetical protein
MFLRHYKIDSIDTQAYLNRAALVGCKNQALSENYAKELYTRRYLRDMNREYLRRFRHLSPILDDLKL